MKKLLFACAVVGAAAIAGFGQNYKIRQSTSVAGQRMESTVYVKGPRKRTEGGGVMGMGADVADVEQCDLKRTVKINDQKKMYAIEPFDDGSSDESPARTPSTPAKPSKTTKGGTVTMTSNVVDTGERKQMFGLTARRIRTTMSMTASPDACMKGDMSMETDGWYVDLPQFVCPMTSYRRPQMPAPERSSGGCRDRFVTRATGGARTGFALMETTTMKTGGADQSFTTSLETLEFSKATLADSLFDIPSGYALVDSAEQLYGKPDIAAMMRGAMKDNDGDQPRSKPTNAPASVSPGLGPKRPGMIRVGVMTPTNRSGENVSTTNLQMFLAQKLTSGKVEAVGVTSLEDARSRGCDYVLESDFSKLRQSTAGKIGGLLGKVTNTDTSGSKSFEAQVDFVLTSVADGKQAFKNKSSEKGKSDADRAAEAALELEAAAVLGALQK